MTHKHGSIDTCNEPGCLELKRRVSEIVQKMTQDTKSRVYTASDNYSEVSVDFSLIVRKIAFKDETFSITNREVIESSVKDNLERAIRMSNMDYENYNKELTFKLEQVMKEVKLEYPELAEDMANAINNNSEKLN